MNGAALECQDQALRLREDSLNHQQSPGYRLERNHLGLGNYLPSDSKTMSYSSDSYVVGKTTDFRSVRDHVHRNRRSSESYSTRNVSREPLDLPVPKFVIDKNYVGNQGVSGKSAKELDLDTRIQMLIKSNALVGVHPIFSEFEESEDSNLSDRSLKRSKLKEKRKSIEKRSYSFEPEDDPNKPLSRPPSPFLSRATYLFWFNKAIEIKEQAKEQEKALLEIANKKLNNNQALPAKPVETTPIKSKPPKPDDSCMLKNLMDELSKELKDVVKEEFIKEMIESTALKVLDDLLKAEDNSSSHTAENQKRDGKDLNLKYFSRTEVKTEPRADDLGKVPVSKSSLVEKPPHPEHLHVSTKNPSVVNHPSTSCDMKIKKSNEKKCVDTVEKNVELKSSNNHEPKNVKQIHKEQEKTDLPKVTQGLDVKSFYTNEKDHSSNISFEKQDFNKTEAYVMVVSESVNTFVSKDLVSEAAMDTS